MKIKVFGSLLVPFLFLLIAVVACNKDSVVSTDELVDEALYTVQERGGLGRYGCFDLLFPVNFTLPDDSEVTANSYDEMKTALKTYFESIDADHHTIRQSIRKVDFVYPISVLNEDGEAITLNNVSELRVLRAGCGGDTFGQHGHHGHGQHGLKCFDINFPLTMAFPDGTTQDAADKTALRDMLRTWKENNPGQQTDRPTLVFPISVTMDDGTVTDVASKEDLRALKEACE